MAALLNYTAEVRDETQYEFPEYVDDDGEDDFVAAIMEHAGKTLAELAWVSQV